MNKKQLFESLVNDPNYNGPVLFYPILMHFAARYYKKTYGEFASDYRVLVESNIKCLEDFNMDMVSLISDPYRETSAFGAPVECIPEGVPVCHKHIIETYQDVMDLKLPEVTKAERTLDRINGARYYQKLLKGTVPVMGWVEGPLAEACDLSGISNFLTMVLVDEDFCNRLMDKCIEFAKIFVKAQVDEGCDLIGVGDAICSQIDEETYVRFVKSRHIELFDYIHSLGAKVKLHICGNTSHILQHIAQERVDIFDPDLVDQESCHSILGDFVVRSGNINPFFIQSSTPEEVLKVCREVVKKERGRKFILSGGCEIPVATPVKNLLAMSNSRNM